HGRFSGFDPAEGEGSFFRNAGRSEEGDTLAHFDRFKISLNYLSLLKGRVNVRKAVLEHPRIFLRQYDSTAANWKMFLFNATEEEKEDSSTFSLPSISVGKAILEGRPLVYYSSLPEAISASLSMRRLSLGGEYSSRRNEIRKVSVGIDSMLVAGSSGADRIAVAIEKLWLRDHGPNIDLDLDSKLFMDLENSGRMAVPFNLKSRIGADLKAGIYEVKSLNATLATIDISGEGVLDLSGDKPCLKAAASTEDEDVKEALKCFEDNFPVLKRIDTDAKISIQASCDGFLGGEGLPPLAFHVEVPDSRIAWDGIDKDGRFDMDVTALCRDGIFSAEVGDFCFSGGGLSLNLEGKSNDILAEDPGFSIRADIHTILDSLCTFLPDSLGISAQGRMDGRISGGFRLSQLDPWNLSGIGLRGALESPGIDVWDSRDTLNIHLGRTVVELCDVSHEEGEGHEEEGGAGVTVNVDTLFAEYGRAMFFRGSNISVLAHNDEDDAGEDPSGHSIHGHLDIGSAAMRDEDSSFVSIEGSRNTFAVRRKPLGKRFMPYMDLRSTNGKVALQSDENRISTGGLDISLSAHPAKAEEKALRKNYIDSIRRINPRIPKDILMSEMLAKANRRELPDYLSEKDFEKKDVHIQLDEGLARIFKEWEIAGTVRLKEGKVITPYFPLDNRLAGLECRLTNDRIGLKEMRVESGGSDISASGSLSGLRKALVSDKGRLKLDLDISSDVLDLNELLLALNAGSGYVPHKDIEDLTVLEDSDYLESVRKDFEADSVKTGGLLVIPANLQADVHVKAACLKYSGLETTWISSELRMKERCLQMTNTMASTNMGDVYLEGFYSTRTKKDLKAGFDLNFSDITAEKVIQLFPAVDSIIPMLKAFKGQLDCEIAATSDIDTTMSIIPSSISGIVKIDGKELSLSESEDLNKLRRTMMFKDKSHSDIDSMAVRGVIRDNKLEIFPFILKIDRYTVALDGTQEFDQHFKYHISAIESPVPVKFGVNLKGSFSDWKWSLGKARYKSTGIPVFDEQINGLKLNLLGAIHNIFDRGVEDAIRQNRQAQEAIEARKAELEYSSEETEELSEGELMELESYEAGEGTGSPAI
ncbi:MAG: hypothetical protein MJY84_08065, partial [Bacteroidales bacterium]|nr:hypothetical protein [Bacteroidales bacterium]